VLGAEGGIAVSIAAVAGTREFEHYANLCPFGEAEREKDGYPLKAGQLTYDCRYSTMHGMPVTGGRGCRGLKPLWYNGVPP